MVFLDSFSMSSPKPRQGPSPPSVEQILEDLLAAKDDDVVFKSPMLGEHVSLHATRDQTKGKTNISASHSDKTENVLEHSTGGREVSEDKGSADEGKTKSQSNEQLYGTVASFLEQFKSLESSQEQLSSLEGDLKSKQEDLEEAISKVKDAWKVDKNDF